MVDKPTPSSPSPSLPPSGSVPSAPSGDSKPPDSNSGAKRPSGAQRGQEFRDAMAEMAERAQLISQEAGTRIAAAMKDVIGAAAGIAGFAVESARDLAQYMVRRGQMTQEEADKLIREAEDAHNRRQGGRTSRPVERPSGATRLDRPSGATRADRPSGATRADRPSGATRTDSSARAAATKPTASQKASPPKAVKKSAAKAPAKAAKKAPKKKK
jgi:hypothetical protein